MLIVSRIVGWIHRQDEVFRVGTVAALGTLASYVTYEIVFFFNGLDPRATTSWAISFVIGVFRQHHLHRYLSFPKVVARYGVTLRREWFASSIVLIFSVALNYYLTENLSINHRIAWGTCLMGTAGMEYSLLKFFVFRKRKKRRNPK